MRFLVQKIHGRIVHDFAFELIRAKEYYDWSGQDRIILRYHDGIVEGVGKRAFDFSSVKRPDLYIPVGSVEFVSAYHKTFYPEAWRALKPLNVPEELFPFAGRRILNLERSSQLGEFWDCESVYLKSNVKIKDWLNGPADSVILDTRYGFQVSEIIDIASEWRVFVFLGEVQHVANYSGDSLVFPDRRRILDMMAAYGASAPQAYTLDVAVTESGETVVIECHRFFSCGLYGFSDHRIIPIMLARAWNEMKRIH